MITSLDIHVYTLAFIELTDTQLIRLFNTFINSDMFIINFSGGFAGCHSVHGRLRWLRSAGGAQSGENGAPGADLLWWIVLEFPVHGRHWFQVHSPRGSGDTDTVWTHLGAIRVYVANGSPGLDDNGLCHSLALNTEAILHSNNTRDADNDRRAGIVTLAILIGRTASHVLYAMLLFAPYSLFFIFGLKYSLWFLLPLVTLPQAFQIEKRFRNEQTMHLVPRQTAKLNFFFGILYIVACCCAQHLPNFGLRKH